MTTLAYRDLSLAADSLITVGERRRSAEMRKLTRAPDGTLAAFCGACWAGHRFLSWVEAGAKGEPDVPDDLDDFEALVIQPDGSVFGFEAGTLYPVLGEFFALGSGAAFAQGAMAAGATAEQAVRIACRFDTLSGGEVAVLRLDP